MFARVIRCIPLLTLSVVLTVDAGNGRTATIIDLASEPAGISILGESLTSNLGTSFATGDVNGDGLEDLITVACNTHPLGGQRTGTVYVIWGNLAGGQPTLDLTQSGNGVSRIYGKPDNDNLYCQVACGDFNDDGFDDIVWGSPQTGANFSWSGMVYIIFGRSDFPNTIDLYLQQTGVVTVQGDFEDGFLGRGLCACDMDGDGYEDLVLSAPLLEHSQLFIIRGRDVFPPVFRTGVVEPGVTRIIDDVSYGGTGNGMACRDINGDGRADLLVGATGAERVLLFYGTAILPDTILVGSPVVPMKQVIGEYDHGGLGIGVAYGDLDADGNQDAVLSAYVGDPSGCYDCGETYILYDIDALEETIDLANTNARMTRIRGFGSSTKYGYRVLCADLSGDIIDDLVLTNRPNYDYDAETTSIIYGRMIMPETILLATENGPITRIHPVSSDDQLGRGVAALDMDLDSVCDLFLGAPYASPPAASYAGIVFGFFSNDLTTSVSPPAGRSSITAFPNPFAQRTTISFDAIGVGVVNVTIFDAAGRSVRAIKANHRGGTLQVDWDGRNQGGANLPSGVYFCRVQLGNLVETRKLVLVR